MAPVWLMLDTHTHTSIVKSDDATRIDAARGTENPDDVVGTESDCAPNFDRVLLTPAVP
jgi:hypothetical protein